MAEKGDNWNAMMRAKAEEAAAHLEGSCESLYTNYEEESNDTAFCNRLNELVFECTHCGWWFGMEDNNGSKHGEWICSECKAEEEDE